MNTEDTGVSVRRTLQLHSGVVIALVIVVVFLGLVAWKVIGTRSRSSDTVTGQETAGRPSMVRDDPVAAYDAALKAGKPIYVLFHSLTCDPCIQISAVADQVVPEYEGKVTFVNVITDDAGGQALAARFTFEYIPTSFFVTSDGTVADSFTGVLTAEEMRTRFDALIKR